MRWWKEFGTSESLDKRPGRECLIYLKYALISGHDYLPCFERGGVGVSRGREGRKTRTHTNVFKMLPTDLLKCISFLKNLQWLSYEIWNKTNWSLNRSRLFWTNPPCPPAWPFPPRQTPSVCPIKCTLVFTLERMFVSLACMSRSQPPCGDMPRLLSWTDIKRRKWHVVGLEPGEEYRQEGVELYTIVLPGKTTLITNSKNASPPQITLASYINRKSVIIFFKA